MAPVLVISIFGALDGLLKKKIGPFQHPPMFFLPFFPTTPSSKKYGVYNISFPRACNVPYVFLSALGVMQHYISQGPQPSTSW